MFFVGFLTLIVPALRRFRVDLSGSAFRTPLRPRGDQQED
jgi:hypothetical protein